MYAEKFEGILYTTFSEQPFKNSIINIKYKKYDYTISDYVSQHFGMPVGESMIFFLITKSSTTK